MHRLNRLSSSVCVHYESRRKRADYSDHNTVVFSLGNASVSQCEGDMLRRFADLTPARRGCIAQVIAMDEGFGGKESTSSPGSSPEDAGSLGKVESTPDNLNLQVRIIGSSRYQKFGLRSK